MISGSVKIPLIEKSRLFEFVSTVIFALMIFVD